MKKESVTKITALLIHSHSRLRLLRFHYRWPKFHPFRYPPIFFPDADWSSSTCNSFSDKIHIFLNREKHRPWFGWRWIIEHEAICMIVHQTLDRIDNHRGIYNEALFIFSQVIARNDSWYSLDWMEISFFSFCHYWWPWSSICLYIDSKIVTATVSLCP